MLSSIIVLTTILLHGTFAMKSTAPPCSSSLCEASPWEYCIPSDCAKLSSCQSISCNEWLSSILSMEPSLEPLFEATPAPSCDPDYIPDGPFTQFFSPHCCESAGIGCRQLNETCSVTTVLGARIVACEEGLTCVISDAGNIALDSPTFGSCQLITSVPDCSDQLCTPQNPRTICQFFRITATCEAFQTGLLPRPPASPSPSPTVSPPPGCEPDLLPTSEFQPDSQPDCCNIAAVGCRKIGESCSITALNNQVPVACAPGLACLVTDAGNPAVGIPSGGFCNFEENRSAPECSSELCKANGELSGCNFFGTPVLCEAFLTGNLLQPETRLT